jgi:hypothetical protein
VREAISGALCITLAPSRISLRACGLPVPAPGIDRSGFDGQGPTSK